MSIAISLKNLLVLLLLLLYCLLNEERKWPKISVFLPTYNKENYIDKCVKSIQNQTLKDIEIIAINDNSNDNTLKILINLANNDNRIKIFNNDKNHGLLYSRAMGILKSSGEYLMNLDPDDELISNINLEYLYNQSLISKPDIINYDILDTGSKNIIKKCTNYEIQKQPKLFIELFGDDNIVHDGLVWNKLVKKEVFVKAFEFFKKEIYNGRWNYFEDDIWSILVNKFAETKLWVNHLVYQYNLNVNSLMHNRTGIIEFQNLLYRHEMYKKIFQKKEDEKYLIAEYYFLLNRLKWQIKEILILNDQSIKEHILNIFQFFLRNYQCSEEQKNDINNFLKLIN